MMSPDRQPSPMQWTRREFVRGAAGVVALPRTSGAAQGFAYVASRREGLLVFSVRGDRWSQIQRVPSGSPACLLLSKSQRTLYVANEVDVHDGLARGTVEAFQVDPLDGRLTQTGLTPLSLSATRPRHMALSPDGRLLAVAAFGGGVYNVLPIADDGALGTPNAIFKDTGCGADLHLQASAHPHSLMFDDLGRLVSSDFGSDRLSGFSLENGRLSRHTQCSTGAGSGPGACLVHSGAATLYAWHELEGALTCYRYHRESATVGDVIQRNAFSAPGSGALALHPHGRKLYSTLSSQDFLRVWKIDEASGRLSSRRDVSLGRVAPVGIVVSPDGESVYVLSDRSVVSIDALGGLETVAVVKEPSSMALRTA